jgi:hypothetical protein
MLFVVSESTVWMRGAEVLPLKFESPSYSAVIE